MTSKEIEDFNYKLYEHEIAVYGIDKNVGPNDYFRKLTEIKLDYVRQYGRKKKILDIGCGGGDYLFELKDTIAGGFGIDYTDKAINAANAREKVLGASHLEFIKANARQLPFEDGAFDLVFSFSALAYIPQKEEVVKEMTRVLVKNGIAILEIGNLRSLNTIVCASYPEYTKACHISITAMKKMLLSSHLEILQWRAFGILPFWADRPAWLRPLLHPRWKEFFQKEIKSKMLDEWVSNCVFLKPWAYRQFFICRKG